MRRQNGLSRAETTLESLLTRNVRNHLDVGVLCHRIGKALRPRLIHRGCGFQRDERHFLDARAPCQRLPDEPRGELPAMVVVGQDERVVVTCRADVANNDRNLCLVGRCDGRRQRIRLLRRNDQGTDPIVDQGQAPGGLLLRRRLAILSHQVREPVLLHLFLDAVDVPLPVRILGRLNAVAERQR